MNSLLCMNSQDIEYSLEDRLVEKNRVRHLRHTSLSWDTGREFNLYDTRWNCKGQNNSSQEKARSNSLMYPQERIYLHKCI
jgi:hypothetical protein